MPMCTSIQKQNLKKNANLGLAVPCVEKAVHLISGPFSSSNYTRPNSTVLALEFSCSLSFPQLRPSLCLIKYIGSTDITALFVCAGTR